MTIAADNVSLALRLAGPDPAAWLARSDAVDEETYTALVHGRRFTEACDFMLAHLARTETTRTRVHGPAPSWADAVDRFACAVDRQQPAQIATISALIAAAHEPRPVPLSVVGKASTSPARLFGSSGPAGSKDATTKARSSRAGSCAPDDTPDRTRVLVPVPGPVCGHYSDHYRMRCVTSAHPHNPDGHYYQASNGSGIPDATKEEMA